MMLKLLERKMWLMLLAAIVMAVVIVPMAPPSTAYAAGTVYYVDDTDGDDSNTGTSEGQAWQSLTKVNSTVFQPGDTIRFKSGGVWTGTLSPQGSGIEGQPITIDKYGEGPKPLIAGAGASAAVYFYNQEQWEVKNLEITNDAPTPGVRRGIHVDGGGGGFTDPKVYKHFLFDNLDIHHVKGDVSQDYAHNGGIIVWGTNWDYHVSDVVVTNSTIYSLDSVGIYIYGAQRQYSSGFKVANNVIHDIAADGAFLLDTTGGVIEHNVVYDTHVRAGGYHVPLWVYSSKDSIIQYNEVYNTAPGGDAMAYDSDYRSDGTIIQYNYSHHNAGGFVLAVNNGTSTSNFNTNTKIRYNISQDDSGAVFNFSGTPDTTHIYNNTVYLSSSSNTDIVEYLDWGGYASNTYFYNNIIYNLGSGGYKFAGSTNNVFENNIFYGNHPSSEPHDPYKITADPKIASPGSAGIGRETTAGYQLLNTSPAIGAGKLIADNGGLDFFGNPVSAVDAPNIGAYQGPGLDPNNLPPLPQPPVQENLLSNADFETGDFTHWGNHYNGAAVVNSEARSGTYAAQLTGSYAGAEQIVSGLYPNTMYKLYAYGKGTGGGSAVVGVKNHGNAEQSLWVSSADYTRKEITFTTGRSSTSATIFLYKSGGSGEVYFDDLEVIQYSAAPGGQQGPEFEVGSSDEFNATTLDDQWQWIRENSSNWSLRAMPGSMQIVSESGDIVDGGATAKNILLTGAPEGDWTIETKMEGKPSAQWSQGGLIVYESDQTYFRLTRLYGSGNQFQFTKQIDAVREHVEVPDTISSTVSYLRIVKSGNTYSGYYSPDGVDYIQVWTTQTAELTDPKIGLIVCAGTSLVASFDYFHITTDSAEPSDPPISGTAFEVTEDAYVRDGTHAALNFGAETELAVKQATEISYNRKAYAKVDFSALTGTEVSEAKLHFYVDSDTASTPVDVYGLTDDSWSESSVTWNAEPSVSGAVLLSTVDVSVPGWYSVDVTNFVSDQLGDRVASFRLVDENATDTLLSIRSKEASSKKPYLDIVTTSGDVEPVVVAAPTALQTTGKTTTSVELNWMASTTPSVTYAVYSGGAVIGATEATAYTVTGLNPNTSYTFTVIAKTAEGGVSQTSDEVTVTTEAEVGQEGAILSGPELVQTGDNFIVKYGIHGQAHPIQAIDSVVDFDHEKLELVAVSSLVDEIKLFANTLGEANASGEVRLISASIGGAHVFDTQDGIVELVFTAKDVSEPTATVISSVNNTASNASGEEWSLTDFSLSVELVIEPADVNGDGKVSVGDLAMVAANFNKDSTSSEWQTIKKADVNYDGVIDITDLAAIGMKLLE